MISSKTSNLSESSQSNTPKKYIGLDCRLSGAKHAGIGRYEIELFSRILNSTEFNFVIFYNDDSQLDPLLKNIKLKKTNSVRFVKVNIPHYSVTEQIGLAKIFHQENLDLLHVPHFNVPLNYSGKLLITIHDLLWHEQKGSRVTTLNPFVYWPKYLAYRFLVAQVAKKASAIIVPSLTVKKTVAKHTHIDLQKIFPIYEGVNFQFSPANFSRDKNTLLYVGSLYPHKNVSVCFSALKNNRNLKLIIISARNIFQERFSKEAEKAGVLQQISFFNELTDEELIAQYQKCSAVIQPSFSEGFGLTGIEALATGTPLIASDIPIFREIYDRYAIYFDPHSSASFTEALSKIPKQIDPQISNIIKNKYDWNKTALETLKLYHHILNGS